MRSTTWGRCADDDSEHRGAPWAWPRGRRERQMTRLLHTSDIHLGETPAAMLALRAVVDIARAQDAELVLFAGDTFDNNRVGPAVTDMAASELARLDIPSVILPGNHDPVDVDS